MQETAERARVRVLHTSSDTPSVDVYVDGSKIIEHLAFGQLSDYITLSADRHQLSVFPVGMSAPGDAFLAVPIQKLRPEDFTLGLVGVRKNLQVAMLEDERMTTLANIEGQLRLSSIRKIADLVDKHPEESVAIMRGWMAEEQS